MSAAALAGVTTAGRAPDPDPADIARLLARRDAGVDATPEPSAELGDVHRLLGRRAAVSVDEPAPPVAADPDELSDVARIVERRAVDVPAPAPAGADDVARLAGRRAEASDSGATSVELGDVARMVARRDQADPARSVAATDAALAVDRIRARRDTQPPDLMVEPDPPQIPTDDVARMVARRSAPPTDSEE